MRHPLAVKVAGTALLCACAILGAVVGAPPARAAELYVDVVAKAGDGSKAKPLATITEALAAAHRIEDESERIVIRLARGTYKSKSAGGKEDIPAEGWTIRRPIWIVGSYTRDGGEWKLKPHSGAVELGYPTTVIDLSGHGRGFLVEAPKWKRSPLPEGWLHDELKQKEATPSVRLQGLAIRSGRVDTEGGAVLSRGDAPLEVLNCDFENNRAAWRGGAICVDPADKTSVAFFRQCVLKGNAATGEDAWGGGIYSEANTHVRKCRLYDNKAAHGAACGGRNASAWNMVFCLAYANEGDFAVHVRSRRDMNWRSRTKSATWAAYDGVTEPSSSGWPWSLGLNFQIARSTIADNAAGGIRFVDAASAEPSPRLRLGAYEVLMRGLIVAGNRGVGISYDPAASAAKAMIQVNNSWGNEGGNWDGATSITGNSISADPRFRDCDNPDLDNRDYSLQPSSPCIAWADYRPNWTMEGKHERDLAGTEGRPTPWGRLWDDNCDMGTYQYVPQEGEPEADREKPSGLTVHELYVDRDWPGPHNGTAEAPFRSITDAVNAVRPIRGPREIYNIRIADGVYDRSIESFGGFGIDLSYQIVNIFGGYEGWAPNSGERRKATFDWREKNRKPRSTIIDPQGDSRAFVTNQEAITHHRFDGLTIRNGRAVGPGGAVITQALGGEAAMVAFNDCLFENNQCTGDGGAIAACTGDFPEYVTNCDFVDNRAGGNGGAVYWITWEESLPLPIRDCRFIDNRAAGDGGAVMIENCERGVLLQGCFLRGNIAGGVGGAFCQRTKAWEHLVSPVVLRRCRVVNNDATEGGAVYVDRNLLTVLQGCVVARNGGGYAVYCRTLPEGLEGPRAPSTWRRANPLWEKQRLQRPKLPGLFAEFCTFAHNTGGGLCYEDTNPEPVNSDTAGVGVTDSIFADNGGPAVADASRRGVTATGEVVWSVFYRNGKNIEGNVELGTGVLRTDPFLDDGYKPKEASPAMVASDKVLSVTDVHGETVALQSGYRMGASGLVSERPDAAGSWQRAEHELYVDTAAKEGGTGTSAAPFQTLAQAVAAINEMERVHRWADRYVVRVAAGTYGAGADENIEPVNFAIDAEKPPKDFGEGLLIEKGRVAFVGGFAGGGDWKQRGKKTTIIDPGRRSRAFAAPPSYDVALGFDGFAFRNGASVCGGGAIRLYGGISCLGGVGRAEFTLKDCLFENNRCWFAGGAVHAGGNCLAFAATDCTFRANEAGQGGAAFVVSPLYGEGLAKQLRIRSCEFDRNRAAQAGGALWTTSAHAGAVVEATIFGHNTASVAPRPRGWTMDLRGGGGVFLLFRPELPADGSNADLVPWPFGYQTSFGGQRLMQQTDIMSFRECRFYGNNGEAGMVIQAQPAFSQAERVFSWMPPWVFEDCRVDRANWDDFRSRAHRRPGTELQDRSTK